MIGKGDRVAVVGDGKLGLLVAQMLIVHGVAGLLHLGRHADKLSLVQGGTWEIVDESTSSSHAQLTPVTCSLSLMHLR